MVDHFDSNSIHAIFSAEITTLFNGSNELNRIYLQSFVCKVQSFGRGMLSDVLRGCLLGNGSWSSIKINNNNGNNANNREEWCRQIHRIFWLTVGLQFSRVPDSGWIPEDGCNRMENEHGARTVRSQHLNILEHV